MRLRLNSDGTVDEVFGPLHLEDLGANGWFVGDLGRADDQISLYADVDEGAPWWVRVFVAFVDALSGKGWMHNPWIIRGCLFYPRECYVNVGDVVVFSGGEE